LHRHYGLSSPALYLARLKWWKSGLRDITSAWNSGRLEAYLDRVANGFRLEDVFQHVAAGMRN
jgi:hypothetical protein